MGHSLLKMRKEGHQKNCVTLSGAPRIMGAVCTSAMILGLLLYCKYLGLAAAATTPGSWHRFPRPEENTALVPVESIVASVLLYSVSAKSSACKRYMLDLCTFSRHYREEGACSSPHHIILQTTCLVVHGLVPKPGRSLCFASLTFRFSSIILGITAKKHRF